MCTDVIQLILIRKVNTILPESEMNIALFKLKLPVNLYVFHASKTEEEKVNSRPHFCLLLLQI